MHYSERFFRLESIVVVLILLLVRVVVVLILVLLVLVEVSGDFINNITKKIKIFEKISFLS